MPEATTATPRTATAAFVRYDPRVRRAAKTVEATLLICEMNFWSAGYNADGTPRTDNDGWFNFSNTEIEKRTALTRYEQTLARKILLAQGLTEEDQGGLFNRLKYRFTPKARALLVSPQQLQSSEAGSWKPVSQLPADYRANRLQNSSAAPSNRESLRSRRNKEAQSDQEEAEYWRRSQPAQPTASDDPASIKAELNKWREHLSPEVRAALEGNKDNGV